jgi:endoglucanase
MPGALVPLAMLISLAVGLLSPDARPAPDHVAAGTTTTTARATSYVNPLAGRPWGTYEGPQEMAWAPYADAVGTKRRLLGYIALTPKAKWFGAWIPNDQIAQRVKDYVANAQRGDPDTLVQMTIFRMVPWEHEACSRLPTRAERSSYKRWIDRFARAVGDTHAAIVLQPDGPSALCAPGGSKVPSHLVAYGGRVLSAQPSTSVYVEAGAADWPAAGQGGVDAAVRILVRGGIRYAHGFALDSTHFDSTSEEVVRAAAVARRLAALGYHDRKAVINTSSNGHPYEYGRYTGKDPDNPFVRLRLDDDARIDHLCHPRHPADHARRRRPVGTSHRRPPARAQVRRRLPLDRPTLALPAEPALRDQARPAAGAVHSLALTRPRSPAARRPQTTGGSSGRRRRSAITSPTATSTTAPPTRTGHVIGSPSQAQPSRTATTGLT